VSVDLPCRFGVQRRLFGVVERRFIESGKLSST